MDQQTQPPADPASNPQEAADVRRWLERVEKSRDFDEPARKQYAKDRRYARGDSGFDVSVNLIGTFIDILTAFLYARNPDLDITPGDTARPPSMDALMDAAESTVGQQSLVQAQQLAMTGMIPPEAVQATADQMKQAQVQQQFDAMRRAYMQRQRDNKAFADTLEIVVNRLWEQAKFKQRARRWVRGMLTVGAGWIKVAWQERTQRDPVIAHQINDLQDNIKRVATLRSQIEDAAQCADHDAKLAEYERALKALEANVERVVARGLVAETPRAEEIVLPQELPCLSDYLDSPWIAQRIPMSRDDAQAQFQLDAETIAKATRYMQRKPKIGEDESAATVQVGSDDAEAVESSARGSQHSAGDGDMVMVIEVWHKDGNCVLTAIEGITRWVKPAWHPVATSRFYPFFLLAPSEMDGQRHPQSLVYRSHRLQDEYNRIRSAFAEHRRRTVPKTGFNAALLPPDEARKLEGATTQEMVGLKLTAPNMPLRDILAPVQYAVLDPALYETQSIVAEMERIWGVQEALSQSIATPKTATEAEIQQTGFHARTGSMRDHMEDVMSEIALYTAEVALQMMSGDDARNLAGPDAFWPEGVSADTLPQLVKLNIRAGTSGKPNTTAEREAWSALMPLLQQGIVQIGQLRGAMPAEMADKLEELMRETVERTGDGIDVERFIPKGTGSPLPMPGAPGDPASPDMPQEQPTGQPGQADVTPPTQDPMQGAIA